jgi:DNA-binding PadR family transcriptional regulator
MKPNDIDIDQILKRYLPRATPEEADAAGERVLQRIRSMRFPEAAQERKPGWLPEFDLAILAAVDQLQGAGTPVTITLKVEELLEERIVSGSAVFLILRLMERGGLVVSSPLDPDEPDALDKRSFKITGPGLETLAAARAAAAGAADPLGDFA